MAERKRYHRKLKTQDKPALHNLMSTLQGGFQASVQLKMGAYYQNKAILTLIVHGFGLILLYSLLAYFSVRDKK